MTAARKAFLARAGWDGARAVPLAGDASARRYERLIRGAASAVLMIAPPEERAAFDRFVAIAARLRALGLSAPALLGADPDAGLMLLEDLGDRDFAGLGDAADAQAAAIEVLIHLARQGGRWDVPCLTPAEMARMTALALPEAGRAAALQEMQRLFARQFTRPPVPALRDVHAENLIWLPARAGLARVGLLDFQDAVMAPPGYDLISLTHDARRDMVPARQAALTEAYRAGLGLEAEGFSAECALLIFQRNLRILGVFRRLAQERGKPGYLTHLPRVFGHVTGALRHPALADLAAVMAPILPRIAPEALP